MIMLDYLIDLRSIIYYRMYGAFDVTKDYMLNMMGAYGRVYNTLDAAMADWTGGKDFKIICGPYCSIRDSHGFERDKCDVALVYGPGLKSQTTLFTNGIKETIKAQ